MNNIVFIVVTSVIVTFVLYVLKMLYQIITYKRPSTSSHSGRARSPASYSGNNKVYIPLNAFNHDILTASTRTPKDKQKVFLNMKIFEYQHDNQEKTMLIRSLYGYVKIITNPNVQVMNDDSDNDD